MTAKRLFACVVMLIGVVLAAGAGAWMVLQWLQDVVDSPGAADFKRYAIRLGMTAVFGGLPCGLGVAMIFAGRALYGPKPQSAKGWQVKRDGENSVTFERNK